MQESCHSVIRRKEINSATKFKDFPTKVDFFFYINAGVIKLTFTFNIPNLVRVSSIFPLSIRKSKVCTQRTISPVTKSTVCCTDFS